RRVEAKNPTTHRVRKAATAGMLSRPAGKWRPAVRGFSASKWRSASRLDAMAALRANTQPSTKPIRSVHRNTTPGDCQASTALRSANGSAKTVWLKRINSKNNRAWRNIGDLERVRMFYEPSSRWVDQPALVNSSVVANSAIVFASDVPTPGSD